MNYFLNHSADIIKAAATSWMGLIALMIIVSTFLAWEFFRATPLPIRIRIFAAFFLTGMVFFAVAVYFQIKEFQRTTAFHDSPKPETSENARSSVQSRIASPIMTRHRGEAVQTSENGGKAFPDETISKGQSVWKLRVYTNDVIVGFEVVGRDGSVARIHGLDKGDGFSEITLGENEIVREMFGMMGTRFDWCKIVVEDTKTGKQTTYGPFGNPRNGDNNWKLAVPSGQRMVGLYGRKWSSPDQVGLMLESSY